MESTDIHTPSRHASDDLLSVLANCPPSSSFECYASISWPPNSLRAYQRMFVLEWPIWVIDSGEGFRLPPCRRFFAAATIWLVVTRRYPFHGHSPVPDCCSQVGPRAGHLPLHVAAISVGLLTTFFFEYPASRPSTIFRDSVDRAPWHVAHERALAAW